MTTVRQPFAEIGATAAELVLVLALAKGDAVRQAHVEWATTLVVRTARPCPPFVDPSGRCRPRQSLLS